MSMKKKRNDQRGDTDICRTADGYDTNASAIPDLTTCDIIRHVYNLTLKIHYIHKIRLR